MERRDNYAIQCGNAKKRFLTYDQEAIIAKFSLAHDGTYLYIPMLSRPYRLRRDNGDLEKEIGGLWRDANSFGEVMTLLDVLCDARPDRRAAGRWKSMQSFGLQFHQHLLEDRPGPEALAFDRDPEGLARACRALNGTPLPGADVSSAIELLPGLSVCLQFWRGDEEFSPRLRWLWDENALMYIKYETMYYAVSLIEDRLLEEMAPKGGERP